MKKIVSGCVFIFFQILLIANFAFASQIPSDINYTYYTTDLAKWTMVYDTFNGGAPKLSLTDQNIFIPNVARAATKTVWLEIDFTTVDAIGQLALVPSVTLLYSGTRAVTYGVLDATDNTIIVWKWVIYPQPANETIDLSSILNRWDITNPDLVSSITVASNCVPLPAAVWFLGSGLIGLAGIRRKFTK